MSLAESIAELHLVAEEAMTLFQQLKALADNNDNATIPQRNRLRALANRLNTNSRQASRERRTAEIAALTRIIDAHSAALATPGLSANARQAIRADRTAKVARRGRLRAQAGTNFGGILTATEIDKLATAVAAARIAVARRKRAASFLRAVLDVAENALRIAGKLII